MAPDALVDRDSRSFGEFIWRLLPFIRPYKGRIAFGTITNGIARLFDLLPILFIGMIVDEISRAGDMGVALPFQHLAGWGVAIFATFIGLAIFQTSSDYAWDTLAQRVRHDIRVRLYDHLQRLDVRFFEDRQTGDLMSVLSNDVDHLENFLADATTSIIRLVITTIGIFIILAVQSWQLALLLFAPMPLAVFAVRFFATRVQPQYRASRAAVGAMNAILENNLQGIGVIQAYTAQDHQAARINVQSAEYRDTAVRAARIRARFVPMLYVIAGFAFAALVSVGGYLTFTGAGPTIGDFTQFVLFATRLIMPLFILGMLMNQIQRSEAAARRIEEVLATEPRIYDEPDARVLDEKAKRVTFDEVTFGYDPKTTVLNGVSFDIREGQVLGVVGPTGAGKSTLIKMLLRYYEPQGGEIRINDIPLAKLQLDSFRQQIGYVSQDAFLFSGTVAENIKLGAPEASDAAVIEAARIAGAAEFIDKLPDGYGTLIGERGMKLSGGQKQRVSLARAILRDPAILILDEATSAIDTRTEELIQQNLHAFRKGRITLAVAHRLSTIRQADEILVVVDGVVVERGDHDALASAGGVYADLWRVQSGQGDETAHDGVSRTPGDAPGVVGA